MEGKAFGSHLRTSERVLKSVVKLFVQLSTPNYSMPWQMKRQQQVFGSGFVISGRRILTNGHVVAYQKSVRVRKHGDAKKYNAHVIHVGHECDIAMLGVDDEKFWHDVEPLEFGNVPQLEEDVVCVGFPTGGDNISVTRGVVSRVEIQRYAHSAVELLAIQIDAAINSGNSGGPALQDDKLIGIAFETLDNAENIGYIIPVTVIKHFLGDIERTQMYKGFCRLGVKWQPIESDHMRSYFQLSQEQTGILVTKVLPLFTCDDVVKRGDVLMAIDGETLADNGTVHFRGNERIAFDYTLSKKYVGDVCQLTILRQGRVMDVEVKLDLVTTLVPTQMYDKRPSYLVYAGLVFVALSQPYMQHQYGKDWARKAPIRLCDRVLYGMLQKSTQEVVILSQVLASELTTGYENMANLQLYKVNGVPILNLEHLATVLDAIIKPHSQRTTEEHKQLTDKPTETSTDGGAASNRDCRPREDCPTASELNVSERIDSEGCVNFGAFSDDSLADERARFTCEVRASPAAVAERQQGATTITAEHRDCGEREPSLQPSSSPDTKPVTSSRALDPIYSGLEDDPTLLMRDDYVHFELDKDKIIVLHIPAACKSSPNILEQYAIAKPRSDDLPMPPWSA